MGNMLIERNCRIVTFVTNNEKLINEVNKFGKMLELEHIEHKKNHPNLYEGDFPLADSYTIVSANNDLDAQLVIVASDIENYIPDKNKYNIQIHSGNIIDGFDSYIYSNDYEALILDILNASFVAGLVSIDVYNIMKITNNKSLNYYRFSLTGPYDNENIKELIESYDINFLNKNGLVIIYGKNCLSLKQIDDIISYFHINEEIYYAALYDEELEDNELILSLMIEK